MSAYHYAKRKPAEAVKVSQSLLKGLKDGSQHNDVKIVLEDGELEANKFVLSVRSEYFSKMFDKDGGFRENQTGDVRIFETHFPAKVHIASSYTCPSDAYPVTSVNILL